MSEIKDLFIKKRKGGVKVWLWTDDHDCFGTAEEVSDTSHGHGDGC